MYTFRTLDTFEWNAKESLARCHCGTTPWRLAFKWTAVWCCLAGRCVQSSDVFVLSGVLYSATLTWTSALETLWNRIAVANWPNKTHLLRTWSRSQNMKEPGNEVPRDRIEQGELLNKIVQNENKDPSNLFTTFIGFVFFVAIFQSSKIERARTRDSRTKTQWNRAKDFSNPLITPILLSLLFQYLNLSKREGRDRYGALGTPPRNTFLPHPPLP